MSTPKLSSATTGVDTELEVPRTSVGRKRDQSLDGDILEAALEVLAEVGASGLTMDLVAERAGAGKASIYRRWTSKSELVTQAVAHMKRKQVDVDHLPDTGTLRGDLLGLFKPEAIEESARKLKIMTGLASLLTGDQALAEAASAAVVGPWAKAHLVLMQRAQARGEISAHADISTLSQVVPSMAAYRSLVQRKGFTLAFLTSMLDAVVLPALGIHSQGAAKNLTAVERVSPSNRTTDVRRPSSRRAMSRSKTTS